MLRRLLLWLHAIWMSDKHAKSSDAFNQFREPYNSPAKTINGSVQAAVQVPKAKNNQQTLRPTIHKGSSVRQVAETRQFPAVRELSTQEQLLVRYAREFPKQALEYRKAQAAAEQERISGELAAE